MVKSIHKWYIIIKMFVFVMMSFICLPFALVVGSDKYLYGVFNGMNGFADEFYDAGLVSKKELARMKKDLGL